MFGGWLWGRRRCDGGLWLPRISLGSGDLGALADSGMWGQILVRACDEQGGL